MVAVVGGGKLQKDFPEVTTVAKFIPLSKIGTFRTISSSFVLCWLGKKKKKLSTVNLNGLLKLYTVHQSYKTLKSIKTYFSLKSVVSFNLYDNYNI